MVLIYMILGFCIFAGIISFASISAIGLRKQGITDNEGKHGWGLLLVFCEVLPIIIVFLAGIGVIPNKMLSGVQLIFVFEGIFFPLFSVISISHYDEKISPIRMIAIIVIIGIGWFCIIKSILTKINTYISLPRTTWEAIDFIYVIAKVILCF